MPSFSLNKFNTNFGKYGGARAYLFYYHPGFPATVKSTVEKDNIKYMTKATSLPESTTEEIVMNWMGMDKKVAGKQTFADWTITLMVDNDWKLRLDFEEWMRQINTVGTGNIESSESRYGIPGIPGTSGYTSTQILRTLNYDLTKSIAQVTLINAWPKSVGPVTLDYSSQEVASFDITFTYDYHVIEKVT